MKTSYPFVGAAWLALTAFSVGCGGEGSAASSQSDPEGGAAGSAATNKSDPAGGTKPFGGASATGTKTATGGSTTITLATGGTNALGAGGTVAMATGGTTAAGAAGGNSCPALTNIAPPVTPVVFAAAPPAPAGGAVAPGTYFLTNYAEYTGPGGSTALAAVSSVSYMIILSSTATASLHLEAVADISTPFMAQPWHIDGSGTLELTGTTYSTLIDCPDSASGATGGYTAGPDEFTLLDSNFGDGRTHVSRFVRQ